MIFHDIQQNSNEWFDLRAGVATSSCFNKIITPKKAELSSQADEYANRIIAEVILGESQENFVQTYWMERGAEMEAEARALYEFETGYTLGNGGFITNDEGTLGCSPDARVLDAEGNVIGGVEIKCPAPWTHVSNLLRDEIDPKYKPQIQGQLLIGGFEFIDWFSFHPDMPPAGIRTERDDEYCNKLEIALDDFTLMIKGKMRKLIDKGVIINSLDSSTKPASVDELENLFKAG